MLRGLSDDLLFTARKEIRNAFSNKNKENSIYKELFIENKKNKENEENQIIINEIYENYTAAFGMIVNQLGFRTAIAMYSETNTQSEGNKKIVLKLLFDILKSKEGVKESIKESDINTFISNLLYSDSIQEHYEDLFKEASIALKRAIRTYTIKKK